MIPAGKIDEKIAQLGILLPKPTPPLAAYQSSVLMGSLLFISGQLCMSAERGLITGRLGENVSLEDGCYAARLCGISLIAQMKAALGDLDRVTRILRLGGFVCATAEFTAIPSVIDGCSNLLVEVFGEAGRHARSAVACPVLPLGAAVEIDAIVAVGKE